MFKFVIFRCLINYKQPTILLYINSRCLLNIPKGGRINFPNFINNIQTLPLNSAHLRIRKYQLKLILKVKPLSVSLFQTSSWGPSAGTLLYIPARIKIHVTKIGTKRQFIPFHNAPSAPPLFPLPLATLPRMPKANIVLCPEPRYNRWIVLPLQLSTMPAASNNFISWRRSFLENSHYPLAGSNRAILSQHMFILRFLLRKVVYDIETMYCLLRCDSYCNVPKAISVSLIIYQCIVLKFIQTAYYFFSCISQCFELRTKLADMTWLKIDAHIRSTVISLKFGVQRHLLQSTK